MVEKYLKHASQSKERVKGLGEVFTPPWLVEEILDKMPQELFADPTKTFLDPSCGDGNFLEAVVKRKIETRRIKERKIEKGIMFDALKTTYGVDIMPDNVKRCKKRLLKLVKEYLKVSDQMLAHYSRIINKNIVCHDALTYEYNFGQKTEKEKANEVWG